MDLFAKIKKIIYSTYLCIRFPFLYPRNRFTDLHYNNWAIIDKLKNLYAEAYEVNYESGFKKKVKDRYTALKYTCLKFFHDYFLQYVFCIPTFTELDMMEDGWRKCFGLQLCKEIKESLLDTGGRKMLHAFRIVDIKEKYGTLNISVRNSTDEVNKILIKYEYISEHTCINCGHIAKGATTFYVVPLCEKCADGQQLDDFFTKKRPFYGYYNVEK